MEVMNITAAGSAKRAEQCENTLTGVQIHDGNEEVGDEFLLK